MASGKDDCLVFDHTDTTLRLGLVTDIYRDRLRTSKGDAEERQRKAEGKEKPTPTPRECGKCHHLIPAAVRVCPACGAVSERQSSVETIDGELHEYGKPAPAEKTKAKKETAIEKLAAQGKQAIFSQLLTLQKERADGWVAHKYKGIFGVWPKNLSHAKAEPTAELQIYIHHTNIKWAKSNTAYSMVDINAA